jgi:hypothetical protein
MGLATRRVQQRIDIELKKPSDRASGSPTARARPTLPEATTSREERVAELRDKRPEESRALAHYGRRLTAARPGAPSLASFLAAVCSLANFSRTKRSRGTVVFRANSHGSWN